MNTKIVFSETHLEIQAEGMGHSVAFEHIDAAIKGIFAPTGILMPAVRWISQGGHAVIMERPPFVARASYRPAAADQLPEDQAQHYNIPVPWQVYGIVFSEDFREIRLMYVYARNSPMLGPDDRLSMFPYPNVFNTAQACMGEAFKREFARTPSHNLAEAIAQVVNTFWSADFNEDAGPNTWYAAWRAPVASMSPNWQLSFQQETIVPWKLLRYYAETALEHFLRWEFPVSNNLNPQGDRLSDLMTTLQEHEPINLSNVAGLIESLRLLHSLGMRQAKTAATPAPEVQDLNALKAKIIKGKRLEY